MEPGPLQPSQQSHVDKVPTEKSHVTRRDQATDQATEETGHRQAYPSSERRKHRTTPLRTNTQLGRRLTYVSKVKSVRRSISRLNHFGSLYSQLPESTCRINSCVKPELTQSFCKANGSVLTKFYSLPTERYAQHKKETDEEDRPSEHKRKDGLRPEIQRRQRRPKAFEQPATYIRTSSGRHNTGRFTTQRANGNPAT